MQDLYKCLSKSGDGAYFGSNVVLLGSKTFLVEVLSSCTVMHQMDLRMAACDSGAANLQTCPIYLTRSS